MREGIHRWSARKARSRQQARPAGAPAAREAGQPGDANPENPVDLAPAPAPGSVPVMETAEPGSDIQPATVPVSDRAPGDPDDPDDGAHASAPTPEEGDPEEGDPEDPREIARLAEDCGVPDPNGLQTGDSLAPFLKGDVPEALRRIALRRMWRLSPVFANLDGLVEYGEDYTDAATVVKNLATLFRPGEGMQVPQERLEELAERARAEEAEKQAREAEEKERQAAESAVETPDDPGSVETPPPESPETGDPEAFGSSGTPDGPGSVAAGVQPQATTGQAGPPRRGEPAAADARAARPARPARMVFHRPPGPGPADKPGG